MTVRLFAAVIWCGLGALVVALCASDSFASRWRQPLLVRACPEAAALPDPRKCQRGYDEGAACADEEGVIDPNCSPDDEVRPTRSDVCAELVRRCG